VSPADRRGAVCEEDDPDEMIRGQHLANVSHSVLLPTLLFAVDEPQDASPIFVFRVNTPLLSS